MTDAEREAELRKQIGSPSDNPWWRPNQYHASDIAFLLRLLDEARAEIAPQVPLADVMKRARNIVRVEFGHQSDTHIKAVARALTEYGDEREVEARAAGFEAGEGAAIDNVLSILDEEGWLGNSRQRIRALADTPPQSENAKRCYIIDDDGTPYCTVHKSLLCAATPPQSEEGEG